MKGMRWEYVSEFKHLRCVLDELVQMRLSVVGRWRVGRKGASAIRSLVNTRGLRLECPRVLHETLLALVFMYVETMIWLEKERSRIRVVQMDNLRGLLGIRGIDKVSNARIREF